MSAIPEIRQPSLIVVTGRPGSGKSTLATALARALRCPLISRDEIKEGFVNSAGKIDPPSDDAALHAYEAFFDTLHLLLSRRIMLIAEAAFQHKRWAPKLEPLRKIARTRILICTVDPQLARSRHVQRGLADADRERFHPDAVMRAAREGREIPLEAYDPPRLDVPTLTVDTSDGYRPSLDTVVSFARA